MPGVRGNNDSSRSKELAIKRASKALVPGDVYLPRHRRPAPQATPASGADLRAQAAAAPLATPVTRKAPPALPAPPAMTPQFRAPTTRPPAPPAPPAITPEFSAPTTRPVLVRGSPMGMLAPSVAPAPPYKVPVYNDDDRAKIARKVQNQQGWGTGAKFFRDQQRMKTLGEWALDEGRYPNPKLPDQEGKERARSRAAESHNLNLHVSNDNVAIHASNYLDGQRGMRQRATPYVRSFFSKKAAEELRVGKEIGKELESIKTQIDGHSPEARAAAIQGERGQNASSIARAARGSGRAGAAATMMATGNPVAGAAVATSAGIVETSARTAAAKSHQQAAKSYKAAEQRPDLPLHLAEATASEGEHQRKLASRAQRQAQKAFVTSVFSAVPGIWHAADGNEQSVTGYVINKVRKKAGYGKKEAEVTTRILEAVVGEAETRGLEKTVNSISARIKKTIGGVSRPEMQAARVSRTRALQEAKRKAPAPEKVHSV